MNKSEWSTPITVIFTVFGADSKRRFERLIKAFDRDTLNLEITLIQTVNEEYSYEIICAMSDLYFIGQEIGQQKNAGGHPLRIGIDDILR